MTIRALMDGRCKPMIGARSAWSLLSFRMRFPISECSFSSLAKRTGVRIQVSHPLSKMGMTKTSNTLNPVSGFKAPWKEPIELRLKKAQRTFEIFSSTDRQGLKSCCHHTPKHLAADCVLMAEPATSVMLEEKGPIENVTASVLLEFSVREFEEQKASRPCKHSVYTWGSMH